MNRRDLFRFLGAGATLTAAGLLVPPAARTIFLPPRGGWIDGNGLVRISRELLDGCNIDAIIRADLAAAWAARIDRHFILGIGERVSEPVGFLGRFE